MKTKLLSALIIVASHFLVNGQSISATITPDPISAGDDVTIDITFTSSSSTDIIQLNLERLDAGYAYVSTVDYQEFVVPSTGTDQTVQYTVTIPAGTVPSSDIGSDFYYYKIELRDSGYNWLAGYYKDPLTVNAASSPTPDISANITPNPINAGEDVTVDVTFTANNATDKIVLNLERLESDFTYVSTVDYQEFVVSSTGTDQTEQYTVIIPAGTTPSSGIGTDFYYYKVELYDSANTFLDGYYLNPLTIDTSLSIQDLNSKTVDVYPNPAKNTIQISNFNTFTNPSVKIFSILGKEVYASETLNSAIDVSMLKSGLYLVRIQSENKSETVKFIKQ
jgi:uncharacterized membrane protein